jgi:hypothetical protein
MSSKQRFRSWPCALAALALAGGACDAAQVRRHDVPQIGLARGSRWSVMSLQPPYLNGPFFALVLRRHVLTGWISGESAPGGALRVRIDDECATGHGPLGPVAMEIWQGADAIVADGMWNGARVHLVFSTEGVSGTVADNARPMVRSPLERAPGGPARSRVDRLLAQAMEPAARNSSCQYLLDARDRSGRLLGTSICEGMPLPTRLEIPDAADALLTRPELVTVLVAMLSAPPLDVAEPIPGSASMADELLR